jgi:uncharacterized protein YegL
MSWDERLFGRLYARLTGRGARAAAARGIAVEPERVRLELIASALAGRRITVALATGPGGLRGHHLIVPPQLDVLPTPEANAGLLLARIVVGALVLRDPPPLAPGDDAQALATFAAVVRARRVIADELPGAAVVVDAAAAALLGLRGPIGAGPDGALEAAAQLALGRAADDLVGFDPRWLAAVARGDRAVVLGPAAGGRCAALALCGWLGVDGPGASTIDPPGAAPTGSRGGRERAGRARDRVHRRQLDERPAAENPLVHSFEKVHTLEKYPGGRKRVDGADDLEAHGDALDELDLDEVVRSATATSGVYRADVIGLDDAGEVGAPPPPAADDPVLTYDEWDEAGRRYRRGWCQVRLEPAPPTAPPEVTRRFVTAALARHRRERAELAAQVARLDAQPVRVGRQPDGPEVDVDAIVDRHGALRHGSTGPDKLYVAARRRPPELAVALLLDRSLSSDAWVADQRVLDVGTAALVALGDALDRAAAATAIVAFASHTRRDCRLTTIKDFAAPWATSHGRLAALTPHGYTRIGPALRHTTALLERTPARRKLLVLLSDGKPTDYDRYEGRYGVADVRRAVDEAALVGVSVFAVALDHRARHHLPQMFGPGGFAVVTRPRDLVGAVGRLYQQRLRR